MQQNPLRQPHPLWTLSTLAMAICTAFTPVQAQQQQKTDSALNKTERIEMTGSRIRRTDKLQARHGNAYTGGVGQ